MKSTGIVRSVDSLGRFVLPKELRDSFGITTDTPIEIFTDGNTILLRKYRADGCCDLCGEVTGDSILSAASASVQPAARSLPNCKLCRTVHPYTNTACPKSLGAGRIFVILQRHPVQALCLWMTSSLFLIRFIRLVAWRG